MLNIDPVTLSLRQAAELLAAGSCSSVELCQAFIARAEEVDGKVHALLALDKEDVLKQAAAADARRAAGKPLSALDGVPVTLKDNIAAEGQPCTCASKILEGFRSPYDAFVTQNSNRQDVYCSDVPTWTNSPWALPVKTVHI